MSRPALHGLASVFVFALAIAPNLIAQTTGEWTKSWTSPTNNVWDFARVISSAGRGDYVMASEHAVYLTSDGGLTWTSILQSPEPYRYSFSWVAYPGRSRIFVVIDSVDYLPGTVTHVGRIIASTDAGSTWLGTERIFPGGIAGISMFDELHGLATLAATTESADSLLFTSDGGATWITRPVPPGARNPYDVHARGPSTSFARAYDTASQTWQLYRTTDAGATWSHSMLPTAITKIAIVDNLNIWGGGAHYLSQDTVGEYRDIIMHSTDGGVSWTTALDTVPYGVFGIFAIAFADANNGMAGAGTGLIYRTSDGGLSWERQWLPSEMLLNYPDVRNIAYRVADEAIAVTGNFDVAAYHGRRTLIKPEIISPRPIGLKEPLEATITWITVAGATAYDLQVADTVYEFNNGNIRYFDEPYFERTGFTDTSIAVAFQPHKLYVIRVRARNDAMIGDWSRPIYVYTEGEGKVLAAPTIITPLNESRDQPLQLDLTWTGVPDAIGYDYRTALDMFFVLFGSGEENHQGTTAHLTGLRPNEKYWARVRARDVDGVMSVHDEIVFHTGNVSSADDEVPIEFSASLRPNTTSDVARLRLSLARAGDVRIDVVNVAGALLQSTPHDMLESGTHELKIDLSSLASGQYFVRIGIGGRVVSVPLVVAR